MWPRQPEPAPADLHKLVEQFGVTTIHVELCVTIRQPRVGSPCAHDKIEFGPSKVFERCASLCSCSP